MAVASKEITHNCPPTSRKEEFEVGTHQRNPSWVVAFVRFKQPNGIRTSDVASDIEVYIAYSDCISVDISNTKSNFLKTATVTLKSTDVWYPALISSGDWMFIWVQNSEAEIDRIVGLLQLVRQGIMVGSQLCDEKSGLKFVGRVGEISTIDEILDNGVRTITQSVVGQAFTEFAASVYFNYNGQVMASPSGSLAQQSGSIPVSMTYGVLLSNLEKALKSYADKFYNFYTATKDYSPDTVMALHLILSMGIDSDSASIKFAGATGTPNDSITIPSAVAKILGKLPTTKKYWQLLNVYLGVQKFPGTGLKWYQSFNPTIEFSLGSIFKRCPARCKGFVPFYPGLPNNQSTWEIMSQFLNPVVNEMYTALRINESGDITPTLIIREKPFSTGLFSALPVKGSITVQPSLPFGANAQSALSNAANSAVDTASSALGISNKSQSPESGKSEKDKVSILPNADKMLAASFLGQLSAKDRTLYGTVPRWKINDTMIRSFSYSFSEANRINFVQVWGASSGNDFVGIKIPSSADLRQLQYLNGNYQSNDTDIARHGLRAFITTTQFDVISDITSGSLAGTFARMNADWLYNGQLKAVGSVTLNGVVDPIVEGDNCQIRGIVFHIESVHHICRVAGDGKKFFTTVLQLSNGLLADGLENENSLPKYPFEKGTNRLNYDSPGWTDVKNEPLNVGDLQSLITDPSKIKNLMGTA